MKKTKFILLLLAAYSAQAMAASAPQSFTYEGKLLNSAGTAPLSAVISLKLDIMDPTGSCLLYSETQSSIDLSQTNGLFAVQVGSAVGDTTKRTASIDQGLSMTTVFANSGQIVAPAATGCSAGYTPTSGDGRLLRVTVTNGGTSTVITPDLRIGSVPNAMVAETIQGQTPAQLTPPGAVISFAGVTCPSGFLNTDGTSQVIANYPALANALKVSTNVYAWGSADTSHFNLPDLRGLFLRGVDGTRGLDPNKTTRTALNTGGNTGNSVGSYQGGATARPSSSAFTTDNPGDHTHPLPWGPNVGGGSAALNAVYNQIPLTQYNGSTAGAGNHTHTITGGGDSETRPVNAYINYCIKY